MRKFIVLFIIFLTGCKLTPGVHSQSNLKTNQLSVLTTKSIGFWELYAPFSKKMDAKIYEVYDETGKLVIGLDGFEFKQATYDKVYLETGVYKIVGYCTGINGYAYPETIIKIEANTEYDFNCKTIYEKTFLGINAPSKAQLVIKAINKT